jgi:uncharacterized RDD family membrane protein YckC
VRKPSGRKVATFLVLSLVYWAFAALMVILAAIHACGMTPDEAARCDPSPVGWVVFAVLLLYAALAIAYFRSRLPGMD